MHPVIYPRRPGVSRPEREPTFVVGLPRDDLDDEELQSLADLANPYAVTTEEYDAVMVWLPVGWDETDPVTLARAGRLWERAAFLSDVPHMVPSTSSPNHE